jgi:hypothetical protein
VRRFIWELQRALNQKILLEKVTVFRQLGSKKSVWCGSQGMILMTNAEGKLVL